MSITKDEKLLLYLNGGNYHYAMSDMKLSDEFIDLYFDMLVSYNPFNLYENLSSNTIEKFKDKFSIENWDGIIQFNKNLTKDLIFNKCFDIFKLRSSHSICKNKNIPIIEYDELRLLMHNEVDKLSCLHLFLENNRFKIPKDKIEYYINNYVGIDEQIKFASICTSTINVGLDFLHKYSKNIGRYVFKHYPNLTLDFLKSHIKNGMDIMMLSQNKNLSYDILNYYADDLNDFDYQSLALYCNIPEKFLLEHSITFNSQWRMIANNNELKNISINYIENILNDKYSLCLSRFLMEIKVDPYLISTLLGKINKNDIERGYFKIMDKLKGKYKGNLPIRLYTFPIEDFINSKYKYSEEFLDEFISYVLKNANFNIEHLFFALVRYQPLSSNLKKKYSKYLNKFKKDMIITEILERNKY